MSAPTVQIQGLNIKGQGLALVDVSIDQDCAYWEWHVTVNIPEKQKIKTNSRNGDTGNYNGNDDDDEDDFFNNGISMKFGVATRKNQDFYHMLDVNEDDGAYIYIYKHGYYYHHWFIHNQIILHVIDIIIINIFYLFMTDTTPMDDGTALMKQIHNIHHGDTIGIAVQQDDLPMVQFLLNGEPLHDIAINRFRGTVYPSVFIGCDGDDEDDYDDTKKGGAGGDDVGVTFVWNEEEFKEMSPSVRFKPLMAAIGII